MNQLFLWAMASLCNKLPEGNNPFWVAIFVASKIAWHHYLCAGWPPEKNMQFFNVVDSMIVSYPIHIPWHIHISHEITMKVPEITIKSPLRPLLAWKKRLNHHWITILNHYPLPVEPRKKTTVQGTAESLKILEEGSVTTPRWRHHLDMDIM